jgi:hypothetical protein
VLIWYRRDSIKYAARSWRTEPFLLYCWVLLVLYSMAYSSFANFGLLNRQRSLVLPALYALIAVEPMLGRRNGDRSDVAPAAAPAR